MQVIELHPICQVYPQMSELELAGLASDIGAKGLKVPIVVHQGKVVDGRNRFLACQIAGVDPTTTEWDGVGELSDFVISLNEKRRHLTPSQKGMVAAEIEPFISAEIAEKERKRKADQNKADSDKIVQVDSKERNRDAKQEAAAKVGVSRGYVGDAKRIKAASPEIAEEVKRGEKSIQQAKSELKLNPPKPTGKCKVNGVLVDDPPDIAAKRASGHIPKGIVVDISEHEENTTVGEVKEDRDEQASMACESLSDDDWLAKFPIREKLDGSQLATFDAEALMFRQIDPLRKTFGRQLATTLKGMRRKGPWHWKTMSFLKAEGPEKWLICPPLTDGGCGGKGSVMLIGTCTMCHGSGYRLNR